MQTNVTQLSWSVFNMSFYSIKNIGLTLIGAALLSACGEEELPLAKGDAPIPDKVDFNFHVKPILSDTCYLCHGPDKPNAKAGLSLSNYQDATTHITDNNLAAIKPGDPHASEAFLRMLSDDESYMMPPKSSNLTLSNREKAIIKKWIEQGAEYKKHWALIKPEKTAEPKVQNKQWPNNSIDKFILAEIEAQGFKPNTPADKETLLRRISFDLTGLPPSIDTIDEFIADNSEDAFAKQVEKLLASPQFGERMAVEWLDIARYADTHGYSTDFYRDMSPYRDWVIDSFNQNRPFDEFVTWQIAGDLLPNATTEQKLATAFNRIHAQNGEGGVVNEEFRVEYVKDRVQTLGTGLLGLTMHCAQCHDHKYDPISAKDYYSTFAFFNNIDDSGQISYDPNDMPVPTMLLPTDEQQNRQAELAKQIAQLDQILGRYDSQQQGFNRWVKQANKQVKKAKGQDALLAYYPFSKKDSVASIQAANNNKHQGKVLFGSELNKKDGPNMVHVSDQGHEAIKLNGDDALYFPEVKGFNRAKSFTVAIEAKIPSDIEEGVLFHYNKAGILYNFKGFDVDIDNNHWIVRLAHTYPYNAIMLRSKQPVQREQWLNVAMSYDGSSKAAGVTFYLNGQAVDMTVERDNLYKDIEHTRKGVLKEIGLKVGARWRSRGLPNALVDNLRVYSRELTSIEIANLHGANYQASKDELLALYNQTVNKDYQNQLAKLTDLRSQQNSLVESVQEVMVMKELPQPRQAYILERGSYASLGEPVQPGVPEAVLPWNPQWPADRRGLAKWLMHEDNPLVARVVINRYWQLMFGQGLVRTPEDFGNQGKLPTHPALLDWLAVEFIQSGWNVKHMIKLMALSATYQQSSIADVNKLEKDPENTLWAVGPSSRLTAEMIRDNALAVSGLLVDKIGGESVKPYQPDGIWKMNNMEYKRGEGEELYRRSMYTIYKRSAPPPNMMAFDAPGRSYSVGVRQETSTPLQALALLNDPQMVEASRVLAENLLADQNDANKNSAEQILPLVYRKITGRTVPKAELAVIEQMYQSTLAEYKNNPQAVKDLLSVGDYATADKNKTAQLAALASVSNILMNHDAAVIKR
ncbi:hypothetical protein DS2_13909 [Catenovulum agarivorans DS-2]|uniref:LamG-like jellyroll fold domain-containing protein n=2 Tax=Catenovulum agarivorans TaxID=1172192 RepID=W7QMN5_9ALTE|nr:hypothetical protein DS2_13909 [Catenovulum agarivorans DS-2]